MDFSNMGFWMIFGPVMGSVIIIGITAIAAWVGMLIWVLL